MDQIAVKFCHHWFWGRFPAVRECGEERAPTMLRYACHYIIACAVRKLAHIVVGLDTI